jgi:hypothetical protein
MIGPASAELRIRGLLAVLTALAALVAVPLDAFAASCRPKRPLPAVVLKSMGPCDFNTETLSFVGNPAQQAACLLRSFDRSRNLGPKLDSVPDAIATRVGQTTGLPDRDSLSALLVEMNLTWDFGAFLWSPLSRGRNNDPEAPQARYLVIHDTSGPSFGARPFPSDVDENPRINNLRRFFCADGWVLAHVVVNRLGAMHIGHDLSEPWRATKFERATSLNGDLKGLFLHVELLQPRRRAPGRGRRNDAQAPTPGFTQAQYDRLALVYVIASVRAGRWLIPAFHAPIDTGIRGGHDDPQNFELADFAQSIDRLMDQLHSRDESAVSYNP